MQMLICLRNQTNRERYLVKMGPIGDFRSD